MTPARNGIPVHHLDLETLLPYLDLHLVGATNGVRLFEAAGRSWADTPYEEDFGRLRTEISEERAFLKGLIISLGHRPGPLKMALARALSVLAEVNPLNPLRRKASAGSQLELESLQSLLKGKEALWSTLVALAARTPAPSGDALLDPAELERLLETSRRQQDVVARVMTETAPDRFLHQ
ncbi:hypothetical protein PTW37_09840 [Arthrobacter agilis]|uniref:hypothetical protein n=1 Tax=Arthrobacter agilis TaxID=37921 RepID=UPI002366B2D9|nr:hypothetical protein [Arthrobacter agilis]WDF32180.1 hypothetical protein PTW37_09840 [Arthrobacter agilis]